MILTAMAKTRSNQSIISQSSKITKINFSILGLQEIQITSKQLGIFWVVLHNQVNPLLLILEMHPHNLHQVSLQQQVASALILEVNQIQEALKYRLQM